jgi:hypothetical protein
MARVVDGDAGDDARGEGGGEGVEAGVWQGWNSNAWMDMDMIHPSLATSSSNINTHRHIATSVDSPDVMRAEADRALHLFHAHLGHVSLHAQLDVRALDARGVPQGLLDGVGTVAARQAFHREDLRRGRDWREGVKQRVKQREGHAC